MAVVGLGCLVPAGGAVAQEPAMRGEAAVSNGLPTLLSLEEALSIARESNPTFQATRNDEGVASWSVREAYGALLPRASVSGGVRYEDGGSTLIGSFTSADIGLTSTPAYYFSSYGVGLSLSLSGQTFFNVAEQRATRRAVEASVDAAELALETAVTQGYVAALRARDRVELGEQRLSRAEENLTLAQARADAGVGIELDAKQARVERGRAEVNVLTAKSDEKAAKLALLEQLGIEVDGAIVLTTELPVFDPPWSLGDLLELAAEMHPSLRSLKATASAERAAARTAWSSYLPTLSANAQLSGYTRQVGSDDFLLAQKEQGFRSAMESCQSWNDLYARLADPYPPQDCSAYELTAARRDSLEASVTTGNRAFPFDFQKQPLTVSLQLSLPIFTGFSRQRQVAQAEAEAADTDYRVKAESLRLKTAVSSAYERLSTANQAVQLEAENRTVADEQLEQARERYRVGLDSFVQLTEAETLKSEADQAYLAAVYSFHEALADLESAVGQPLRRPSR